MNYVQSIIHSILTEETNLEDVTDAIKKRYEVEINYVADDDKHGQGKRVIQPVVLGRSKAGNLIVRAFQPYGDTKTKTPSWKTFRLDRFEDWTPLKKRRFNEPPDSQYDAEGKYNPEGDRSMIDVLVQADFTGSQKYQRGEGSFSGLKKHNDEVADNKRKENPYYDLKKNIERSYNGNNIDYIRRNIENWKNSSAAQSFRNGSNDSSIHDMSQIKDFGDDETTQTVGPVTKDNIETIKPNNKKPNYSQVRQNGPRFKSDIENNNIENKEDNGYDESRESDSSSTTLNDRR